MTCEELILGKMSSSKLVRSVRSQKIVVDNLRLCAEQILPRPTAPYHEYQVRSAIFNLLQGLPHLRLTIDSFGNLVAHYQHKARPGTAFGMVAHMDHPGFVPEKSSDRTALFLGGVREDYFRGASVAFYEEHSSKPVGSAVITETEWTPERKRVLFDRSIPAASFGMWNLPALKWNSDQLIARACDDLVGVTTICAVIRTLAQQNARAEIFGVFTRAEEVGFHGTLALLSTRNKLPRVPILSLETSNAQGFAKIGDGPIIRVGDRTSVFDSYITYWLQSSFEALKTAKPKTRFQRLLMGGGTCEATPFQLAGYPTGALCLGLKNYHNMGPGNKIRPESVSVSDWQQLYQFLVYLAVEAEPFLKTHEALRKKMTALQKEAVQRLQK